MTYTVSKIRKINSGQYNMRYLQDKKKHPDICLTYSTCSKKTWYEYFKVNQESFNGSGQNGRCVQAREFILIFPKEFYNLNPEIRQEFLERVVEKYKALYGIEIYAAMHGSDRDENNLHIHCMYMEREQIVEQDKIAKRNMYFSPEGKQVRAKKDAVDPVTKELLPGFRMVPKGECYGNVSWTAKDKFLRSNEFTRQIKETLTEIINKNLDKAWAEGMEQREVCNRSENPYLALQDDFGGFEQRSAINPKETVRIETVASEDIRECNALRREYNEEVRVALDEGVPRELLIQQRKEVSAEILDAVKNDEGFMVRGILDKAVDKIIEIINQFRELAEKLTLDERTKKAKSQKEHIAHSKNSKGYGR